MMATEYVQEQLELLYQVEIKEEKKHSMFSNSDGDEVSLHYTSSDT